MKSSVMYRNMCSCITSYVGEGAVNNIIQILVWGGQFDFQ